MKRLDPGTTTLILLFVRSINCVVFDHISNKAELKFPNGTSIPEEQYDSQFLDPEFIPPNFIFAEPKPHQFIPINRSSMVLTWDIADDPYTHNYVNGITLGYVKYPCQDPDTYVNDERLFKHWTRAAQIDNLAEGRYCLSIMAHYWYNLTQVQSNTMFTVSRYTAFQRRPMIEHSSSEWNSVFIRWRYEPHPEDEDEDDIGYLVYFKHHLMDEFDIFPIYDFEDTSFTLTGLKPEQSYCFQVAAFNKLGASQPSYMETIETKASPQWRQLYVSATTDTEPTILAANEVETFAEAAKFAAVLGQDDAGSQISVSTWLLVLAALLLLVLVLVHFNERGGEQSEFLPETLDEPVNRPPGSLVISARSERVQENGDCIV